MNRLCTLFAAGALIATAGCDRDKTPEPIAPQNGGVIPQAQLDTLNKAKAVEGALQQADRQRQEQAGQ